MTGANEELTLTSSDAKLECDACVVKFADNGGCELALSGKDPVRAIPEGCDSCGDQAEKFCINERDGGAEIIPPVIFVDADKKIYIEYMRKTFQQHPIKT